MSLPMPMPMLSPKIAFLSEHMGLKESKHSLMANHSHKTYDLQAIIATDNDKKALTLPWCDPNDTNWTTCILV